MRSTLTSRAKRVDGKVAHDYQVWGKPVTVFDSAYNVMMVIELFSDETLSPNEKAYVLPKMLLADPEQAPREGFWEWIAEVVWESCALDILGNKRHERPVFDFEQDASRIRASLRMAYGIDWDAECTEISYREFCDLLGMLCEGGEKTPFSEAIKYRVGKPPKATKYNQAERMAWQSLKRHYALKHKSPYIDTNGLNRLCDMLEEQNGRREDSD